jgi:hypothetical protein
LLKLFLLVVAREFLKGVRTGKLIALGLVEFYHILKDQLNNCDGEAEWISHVL